MDKKGGWKMKVQVIGIQKLSFPDSVTGELIQMTKLHCVGTEKEVSQDERAEVRSNRDAAGLLGRRSGGILPFDL